MGVSHSKPFGPDDLLIIDDRKGQAWYSFFQHLPFYERLQSCNDRGIVFPRRNIGGVVVCQSARASDR
jgi:hypothetical protein